MEEENTPSRSKGSLMPTLLAVVAILGLLGSGIFYFKYQKANKMLNNPSAVSEEEAKKLADKISKFYSLPKDETPSVATVLDIEKLKDQPFFTNAQNGDKVLIYQKAGTAILFRPKENKIITVSPVVGGSPAPTAEAEENPEATTKPTAKPSPTEEPAANQ